MDESACIHTSFVCVRHAQDFLRKHLVRRASPMKKILGNVSETSFLSPHSRRRKPAGFDWFRSQCGELTKSQACVAITASAYIRQSHRASSGLAGGHASSHSFTAVLHSLPGLVSPGGTKSVKAVKMTDYVVYFSAAV